ncbi:hypothetical protein E5288_WYG003984 [Bos mutus]|uniref:Uncharacterized protein n=1 Tax=Bos mutus TaxID=72004 RepID=A0A6B0S717_9CETA|nr:hypothetical protein [Bos mutus]
MHNSTPDNPEDGIPCRSQVTRAGRTARLAAASQRAWPSLLPETTPQPARSRGQLPGDHPTASEEPKTASRRRPAGNGGPHVTTCKGLDPPNHWRNLLPPQLSLQTQPSLLPPDCETAEQASRDQAPRSRCQSSCSRSPPGPSAPGQDRKGQASTEERQLGYARWCVLPRQLCWTLMTLWPVTPWPDSRDPVDRGLTLCDPVDCGPTLVTPWTVTLWTVARLS